MRSRKNSCRGKAVRITYSEFISVALIIQRAKRMFRTVLSSWPVWLYRIFSHYLINDKIKKNLNINFHFDFLYLCPKYFLFWEEFSKALSLIYKCFNVNYSFLWNFKVTCICSTKSRKHSYQISWKSIKLNRVLPLGRTDRQTWRN